ncbi:MAG: hypothetical protein FWH46_01765 [Methanimicrococcus sp.]|nr:hypothetical protein [Methanimicrococcus sp.]
MDFQTRSVSNKNWILLFISLFSIILAETAVYGFSYLFKVFAAAFIFFILSFFCYSFRLFGSADGKALIFIAAAFPFPFSLSFLSVSVIDIFLSFPFAVFFISLLLSLMLPIFNLMKNGFDLLSKEKITSDFFWLGLLGFKMNLKNIFFNQKRWQHCHFLLLEKYDSDFISKKKTPFGIDLSDPNVSDYLISLLNQIEVGRVPQKQWVTIGIPFLIPITLSFWIVFFASFQQPLMLSLIEFLLRNI